MNGAVAGSSHLHTPVGGVAGGGIGPGAGTGTFVWSLSDSTAKDAFASIAARSSKRAALT
jgi:hypothetical protein